MRLVSPHQGKLGNWAELSHIMVAAQQIGKRNNHQKNSGYQSIKENITMRSIGHLYLPYTKLVQWCDGLMGPIRVSGVSEPLQPLVGVALEVAQACCVTGVSMMEEK